MSDTLLITRLWEIYLALLTLRLSSAKWENETYLIGLFVTVLEYHMNL